MDALTVEAAESQLKALAESLIQKLRMQHAPVLHRIPEVDIELQPGEHYAGPVLDAEGKVLHHLVLMAARPSESMDWDDAMAWADEVGGSLPNRQEQALLFSNCKPHLKPAWHWSCQEHEENTSCAWRCTFSYGSQSDNHKSAEGAAVAVRRVNP
ncbi:MAG: hypothetical protein C0423_14000 [Methylibium sp.]|nr:hypothetical protein [Methylibium sp.]